MSVCLCSCVQSERRTDFSGKALYFKPFQSFVCCWCCWSLYFLSWNKKMLLEGFCLFSTDIICEYIRESLNYQRTCITCFIISVKLEMKKPKFVNCLITWFFFINKWWTGMGCSLLFPSALPSPPHSFLSTENLTMLRWPTKNA